MKLNTFDFCCILSLVFLALKVFNVINWGWTAVFSPLIIYFGLWISIFLLVILLIVLAYILLMIFNQSNNEDSDN